MGGGPATAHTRFALKVMDMVFPKQTWSEFRSNGIGIRSSYLFVVAFSAANRFPLRRKML